ncbi:zinc ribbon domain-containing protein [Oerskovia enterophila]|uniref:Uncharacterized protein n=1 Tax=Oerskovia enterophila TaxID=43678 RepID=A0ABX2Y8E4_9CELL|nr:zinc ribbon domain-containing protein [Oerskovia enterophila]OCI32834.1 hypothetical protein OERS_04260 [Oerskovia enterophila]
MAHDAMFDEHQHVRATDGKFAPKSVDEVAGGLSALGASSADRDALSSAQDVRAVSDPPGGTSALPTAGGEEDSTWPGVTDADVEAFTLSGCDVLANELHSRTGWPVVLVCDGPAGGLGWVHAGVQAPDGRVIDAAGIHDSDKWLDDWGEAADAFGEDVEDYDGDDLTVLPASDLGWSRPWHGPPSPEDSAAASRVADLITAAPDFPAASTHDDGDRSELCQECGHELNDNEGYDGMCGSCVDARTCPECGEMKDSPRDEECPDCMKVETANLLHT